MTLIFVILYDRLGPIEHVDRLQNYIMTMSTIYWCLSLWLWRVRK